MMDDWERHVTPLLQDMCPNEEAHDDFFTQQDVSLIVKPLNHVKPDLLWNIFKKERKIYLTI